MHCWRIAQIRHRVAGEPVGPALQDEELGRVATAPCVRIVVA
jgi:hypothetical protein